MSAKAGSLNVDITLEKAQFDRGIQQAQAQLRAAEAQIHSLGAKWSTSSTQIKGAIDRVNTSAGAARSGFQQLGFQINDVSAQMANGTKASVIFAQQSGQFIQAIQLMSGGTSKFATFMGGPWGVALGIGISVLGGLIPRLLDTESAADKAKKANMDLSDAIRQLASGTAEAQKALDDYNAAQGKARSNAEYMIKVNLGLAESNLKVAQTTRERLAAELASKEANLDPKNVPTFFDPEQAQSYQAGVLSSIAKVRAEIAKNDAALKTLGTAAINLRIEDAKRSAEGAADPMKRINNLYDDQRDRAIAAAAANDNLSRSLTGVLTAIERKRKAALDAQKETSRTNNPLAVSPADVAAILGVTPTSGTRTVARNRAVGGADNSFHVAGQAIDFPIGKWSKELIRSTLSQAGIRILELLGPGDKGHSDHFHVAFAKTRRSQEDIETRAATAARQAQAKAEREREEAIRRSLDFANMSAGVDQQMLQAKIGLVDDQAELARITLEQIGIEAEKYRAGVEAKVKLGDLTEAQGLQLLYGNAIATAMQAEKVARDELRRKADEALKIQTAANDNEIDILRLQEQMAVTQEERRRIQLAILAHEKESERNALIAAANDPRLSPSVRATAAGQLGSLDQRYGLRDQGIRNSTAGPLERYLRDTDPAKLGERAEELVVQQLDYVQRGISDAIAGALGVQDPLLRGLIEMFIEQVLIRPIAQALQGSMASAGGGGGLLGSLFSLGASAVGGFSGGGGFSLGQGAAVPNLSIGGYASGTPSASPGYHWVGENGPEIVKFRGGESVFNRMQLAGMAANNNSGNTFHINVSPGGTPAERRQTAEQTATAIRRVLNNR